MRWRAHTALQRALSEVVLLIFGDVLENIVTCCPPSQLFALGAPSLLHMLLIVDLEISWFIFTALRRRVDLHWLGE